MKIIVAGTNQCRDLGVIHVWNCAALDNLPKPSFLSVNYPRKATENWLQAKAFLKALGSAWNLIGNINGQIQPTLAALDSYVTACRELDATERESLKTLFSPTVISLSPAPRIQNRQLYDALKDQLRARVGFIQQFFSQTFQYNEIVRSIRYYHSVNLRTRLLSGSEYIEGFPSSENLPKELKLS